MPIKGITDKIRLSRGGHLRLGTKKTGTRADGTTYTYPAKSDHFIFESDNPDLVEQFKSIYGAEPKRITIRVVSDEPFSAWYKCWGQTRKYCQGDGENAQRWTETGYVNVPCPAPENCDFAKSRGKGGKPGCAPQGVLQCLIYGLSTWSVFQVNSGGYHSIVNVNSVLSLFKKNGRQIAGQWFDLVLRDKSVEIDGKKTTIYCLHLDAPTHKMVDDDHLLPDYSVIDPVEEPPCPDDRDDEPVPPTAAADSTGDYWGDKDVQEAVAACPKVKADAIVRSAKEHAWSKQKVLETLNYVPRPVPPAPSRMPRNIAPEMSPADKETKKLNMYEAACEIATPVGGKEAVDNMIHARGATYDSMTWEEMDDVLSAFKETRREMEEKAHAKQSGTSGLGRAATKSAPAPATPVAMVEPPADDSGLMF